MIKKRPTLPIGYSLAGLPSVSKALHSDDRCEVYNLLSSGAGETILLLVQAPDGSPLQTPRLADWLTTQYPQVVTVLKVLTAEESPSNMTGFVLALRGRRIEDESFKDAKEGNLKQLFHAMLDVVDRGRAVRMYPDFDP